MSILIVISFRLEQQAWFRVCVVPLVPITFHFIITWLDVITDRLHLHELSRQRCRDHQHSELIQDINWIHDEKYHPCLDELYYHRPLYCLPTNTSLFMFGVIPWVPCYPAVVLLYLGVLPSFMSRMFWDLFHLLRILDIEILLTITILSWSPC